MMRKTKTLPRILAVLLLLCSLMALFGGCKSDDATNTDSIFTSTDTAVTYFARQLKGNDEAREKFVAASRGYNMSAEGFNDADVQLGVVLPTDIEAARAALAPLRPADYNSQVKFDECLAALDATQISEIVTALKTEVNLTPENGPIDTLLVWIGKFLQVLTKITGGNYVLGLFFFAIVVEILMLYFGVKQQKNMIKQASLRPKEMAIRKKYAGRNDQVTLRKQQEEIQQLYQKEGFNPMGGCLPLLVQIPIMLALYNIVIDPLRYVLGKAETLSAALTTYCNTARAAGGLGLSLGDSNRGTIELLSQMSKEGLEGLRHFAYFTNAEQCYTQLAESSVPNFNLFGLNMGLIPGFHQPWVLLLVPVLTFVLYFASMKLNRKFNYQPAVTDPQMGCSNNMMDITMPLMSVYITFIVPAAVGIYWMFKCVITMVKQVIMTKVMPLPVFTEEDYKAAERAMKGKPPKKRAGERTTNSGKQVRSLHHIDDEDDALPPPAKEPAEKEGPEGEEKSEAPEQSRGGLAAPLKEDRKNDNKK